MWSALFPGQGSQTPGMGKFLWDEFVVVQRLFEEASDTLKLDFKKLCFSGTEAELALTENTQPCLLLVSCATQAVLESEFGFMPKAAAGHSVGEYAAVVAAGALPFASALQAVRVRGQAMQAAVPVGEGGMTAVMGLDAEAVFTLCRWAEKETGSSPVQPANINAPGQIVISGKKSILEWIPANFKADLFPNSPRVKFIPLKVSAPFHCAMMKPAEDKMAMVLEEMPFSEARFPVVQNVNAEPVREAALLKRHLVQQISAPVRWIECVQKLVQMGATSAIEVGSGKVIAGLVKKICADRIQVWNVNSIDDLKTAGAALSDA